MSTCVFGRFSAPESVFGSGKDSRGECVGNAKSKDYEFSFNSRKLRKTGVKHGEEES